MTDKTFEQAMADLEKIVRLLEDGNISLDNALQKFEEGIGLARICSEKLAQAEKKIDLLITSADGSILLESFQLPGDGKENG
ncbi:MAG: exodeoxyribonuclease VII small subunit [Bacillota bacterium]